MSLDLSTIKFSVETTELDTAVKKIETLGKSVEGLATSLGKLDKSTAQKVFHNYLYVSLCTLLLNS